MVRKYLPNLRQMQLTNLFNHIMPWYKVSNQTNFSIPFIIKVTANGKAICLVNAEGELYALSATCPHAGADLSKGWCRDGMLICPFHRYAYNLETGRGAPGQNDFVTTYPVQVRTDGIYVEVTSWFDGIKKVFRL